MKPNFALSLSFDGLRLMHRVTGGWHMVGQVALDDADLTGALARLRAAADDLEPNGISTKLLIPNDQIKYLALDTTRAEEDEVREALHGATPYGVDDLVYDYAKGGGRTYVAAVAKETLSEAQQFAAEHGFNPVSFAAVPEPFTYVGEAFFGAVDGNDVERDEDSVIVIGTAAVAMAAALPEQPELEADAVEPAPDVQDPVVEEPAEAAPVQEEVLAPEPEQAVEDAPEPEALDVVVPEIEEAPLADVLDTDTQDVAADTVETETPEQDTSHPEETALPEEFEPSQEVEDPAPMFASRLRADRNEGRPTPVVETAPKEPLARAEPTFSRQAPKALAVPTGQGTDPMPALSAPSRTADATPATPPLTTQAPQSDDVAPAITGDAPTALSPDAAVSAASLAVEPDARDEVDEPTDGKPSAAAAALGAATAVGGAVGGMFASRRMARAETKAQLAEDATDADASPDEKSRLTVFGARKQPKKKAKVAVGGKPRFLGLILTAVLLLFLLAIAAFAALSEEGIARWFGFGSSQTQIAADETTPTSVSGVAAPQANDTEALAVSDAPDTLAAPTAPSGGQVLTPEEATRIYAATGVWQRAPRIPLNPRTTTLDTMTLAVMPRPVVRVPPSPLASASSVAGDAVIATPIDPPPPSQTFDFNADGLVVATPQGAVTPDGILVIVGRPSLNPPTRPGTVAPVVTPQDQLAAVIPETATPITDAPEGVIVIAGRPAIEPPTRTITTAPVPTPQETAIAAGNAPLLATDGLLVLAGSPPILPPVRTGTVAPVVPDVVAIVPDVDTPDVVAPEALPEDLPEGLNVIAGAPPILPPARPGTVAPQETVDSLTQDIAAALTTSTAQTPDANTRRPTQRPAGVQQAAIAAAEAEALAEVAANTPVLGDLTVGQAAGFRPRTRPAGLAPVAVPDPEPAPEDAVVVPTPVAPIGLQIAPEIAAAVAAAANRPNPIVNPTAQAVPRSSRPDTRPRNMDRIVARAAAAQERAAVATQAAAVAPRTVAPSGPTGSSVARAATLDNAINLREVNLIGIYGGSGDRRALVRMSNGRYVRVTVGDRLDGGRVTAISASALSYTKRGRAITLQVAS